MRNSILLFILLWVCSLTFGQGITKPEFVPGELIVQLDGNTVVEQFATLTADTDINDVQVVRQLSKVLNIWLISFDDQSMSMSRAKQIVSGISGVKHVQLNHIGEFRDLPNDPLINQQWHIQNSGSGGGIAGADINIEDAWKITTGGVTSTGDTIVVAVIDRGFDMEHEDLVDNIWVNHKEIPGNGIDDDNNGYVDDYYGWNASDNNSQVASNGNHGVLVNGVVGAKGNNGIGVTGVNWDVKIMQIRLDRVIESDVIVAYDYILNARTAYNNTKGEEGSFVVASNASWGINYGQPDEAPIWCAIYDALGEAGVLNTGATANLNIDIDIWGDLPTGCPSEYLLSVSSTNNRDRRGFAGYGKNTIDISAPGVGIFSTRSNNRYASESGTSFAAPMVAGTVALMYSSPCLSIGEEALTNPAQTALLIRDAIIDGSKRLPELIPVTKFGGRLDVYNALLNVLGDCRSCPQAPPVSLVFDEVNALEVSWVDTLDVFESYNLRYRAVGEIDWIVIEDVTTPTTIEDLSTCSFYEVALEAICDEEEVSILSDITVLRTDGCCEPPRELVNLFMQPTATRIQWREVIPSGFYFYELQNLETGSVIASSTGGTNQLLRQLRPCTEYEFRIAAICGFDTTDFSTLRFRTLGCGACTEKTYCPIPEGITSPVFIKRLTLREEELSLPASEAGFKDLTEDVRIDLEVGEAYAFTLELDTIMPGMVNIKAWIDYNHNGFFNPDEEAALTLFDIQDSIITRTIPIPPDARQGTTRMRVAVWDADLNEELPTPCGSEGFFGEYKDFCVRLMPRVCPPAEFIDTVSVGFTQAEFVWVQPNHAISYLMRYKRTSELEYSEKETFSDNEFFLDDLIPCTSYDFELRTICEFDTSAYQVFTFETMCATNYDIVEIEGIQLTAYPNPFSDVLHMNLILDQPSDIGIRVTDISGTTIYVNNNERLPAGEHDILMHHMYNKPPGMYIIEVMTNRGVLTTKAIKQ